MIAIIDYNAGNVQSVLFALQRLDATTVVTNDPEQIRAAEKVIFPGVGEASTTMQYLKNLGLDQLIPTLKQPVLGICLGMQLLCAHSEEGDVPCLGVFPQRVKRFEPTQKVPHVGWNTLSDLRGDLFDDTEAEQFVYFVHSYYVEKSPFTVATTDYILPFSAALQKDNFYATQFHPEKSGATGRAILERFLNLKP